MTRLQQLIDAIPDEPDEAIYQWGNGTPSLTARALCNADRINRRDAIIRAYHEALSYSVRHPTTLLVGTEELLARFEKEFGDGK